MHHNFFIIYFVKVKILDLLGSKNDTLCRTEGIYTYGKAAHTHTPQFCSNFAME